MIKMLFILNIANRVNSFSYTSMKAAQELEIDYHIAGNWNYACDKERIDDEKKYGIHIYQIDFIRAPYHPGNIKAYKQLKKIVLREGFDVIHCNTPIGGVVGRLVGKSCKVPTIIYQAHGFHFYKGAPLLNWMVYYPIERWLARYTDALITINQEDYERARLFNLKNQGNVYYVPGVGIDIEQYHPKVFDRNAKRRELRILTTDIMIISAGDLIKRKNYKISIEAIAKTQNKRIHYFICGEGPEKGNLQKLALKLGIEDQVHFLGFRKDIKELLWTSDIFLFTTLQEGLPRSLSEAMAIGLPVVASRIRGNVDLICDGEGGFLIEPNDSEGYSQALKQIVESSTIRNKMSQVNLENIKKYDVRVVEQEIRNIYTEVLKQL